MPPKASNRVKLAVKGLAAIATVARKVANRKTRTRTASKTTSLLARKLKFIRMKHGAGDTSVFTHKNKCPKYMAQVFRQNAPQNFITNQSNRLTIPCGQQLAAAYTALTGTQTAGDFSQGDMGQMLNSIYGATPTNAQQNTRLYIQSVKHNFMFTNNQTNNIFVDMYDIVARRDACLTPATSYYAGLTDQGVSNGYNAINVTPFMSKQFTTYWKVVKRTSLTLGPGESHRHIVTMQLNKEWSATRMEESAQHYAGLTHGTMLVAWGAPDHDATGTANVSTGSVLIDLVYSRQIVFAYTTPQIQSTRYITALPTITTERNVNEESGAPATVSS